MLREFLTANRGEILKRCEAKVALRNSPADAFSQPKHGVPQFIDQLGEALRRRELDFARGHDGDATSTVAVPAVMEGSRTAALHGKQLQEEGYTVDQVVHDYGDICQAITELAREKNERFTVDEFQILNRLLDNAIADAVSSYEDNRDQSINANGNLDLHQRLGVLADEQRQHVVTALKALDALRIGNIGLKGATGALLEDSLLKLRDVIDKSHPQLRLSTGMAKAPQG